MHLSSQSFAGLALLLLGCSGAAEPTAADQGETTAGGGAAGSNAGTTLGGAAGAGAQSEGGTLAELGGAPAGGVDAGGSAGSGLSGGGAAGAASDGSAGSGGGAMMPPGPIDYGMWALQLPIGSGSPTTIKPAQLLAGFMDEYFYPADDGGQLFMDPVTGVTTSGSVHCRSEMRESAPDGSQVTWAASATNRMTVEGKVVKGGGATITIGQILNATDSFPLCEFEWSSGKNGFQLFYEEAKGGGQGVALNTPWPQNQRYTFTLELSNNKLVYSRTPSADMLTKKFYFKFGDYDQNTSAGPVSTAPHSIVEAYKVDVVHQ